MPAVNIISELPKFTSPEEHQALTGSTPTSFSDIPPVLKHKQENVSVKLEPPVEGFTDQDAAQGTIYVITSVLAFISTTGKGFQIEYPAITLHAVSRGEQGPSIYCQLDDNAGNPNAAAIQDDEDSELRELSIIPQNVSSLEQIFEALSACAALHPDENIDEDDEDDHAFLDPSSTVFETFDGTDEQELSEVGRAALNYLESIIYDPFEAQREEEGAFDDAEEDDEGEVPPDSEDEGSTTDEEKASQTSEKLEVVEKKPSEVKG